MYANRFLNSLVIGETDQVQNAFEAMLQDKVSDTLEVRKVELASNILDDIQEEEAASVNEGEGMDAQRKWVRQVAGVIGTKKYPGGKKQSMPREQLKDRARSYFRSRQPHGAEFVATGAAAVRDARKSHKLRSEEVEQSLDEATKDFTIHRNDEIGEKNGLKKYHSIKYKGRTIGDVHRKGPGDWESLHHDSDLSWDGHDNKESAFKAVRDAHLEHKGIKSFNESTGEEALDEAASRKDFKKVADLLKNIPDMDKRKELAQHHAGIFKSQNPRFDHKRFYAAAGVNEEALDEIKLHTAVNVLRNLDTAANDYESSKEDGRRANRFRNAIKRRFGEKGVAIADKAKDAKSVRDKAYDAGDNLRHRGLGANTKPISRGPRKGLLDVDSLDIQKVKSRRNLQSLKKDKKVKLPEEALDELLQPGTVPSASKPKLGVGNPTNILTNIRRATQILGIKGINPQIAARAHLDFAKLVSKNPKAPGYMLLRKLAPNKAASVQQLTQAGVPLGGALEAKPTDFNQALQRIKRFK